MRNRDAEIAGLSIGLVIVGAVVLFCLLLIRAEVQVARDPLSCTTDTDCARKFGGDGGPVPPLARERT